VVSIIFSPFFLLGTLLKTHIARADMLILIIADNAGNAYLFCAKNENFSQIKARPAAADSA